MHRIIACAALLLVAACGSPPRHTQAADEAAGEALRTDRTVYVARRVGHPGPPAEYAFTLIARYENRTGAPVYLSRCSPNSRSPMFAIVLAGKRKSGTSAYTRAWACVGHGNQIEVQPGAVRIDSLLLSGPNVVDGLTGVPIGELEGPMRLVYYAQACPGEMGCPLPDSLQRSNEFEVRTRQ